MPTLTVKPEKLVEVCTYLRDQQGKNFLSAVSAVDHLGYGDAVAGYFGTERGRDLNAPGSWGAATTPEQPPKRFAVRYHLAHVGDGDTDRVRVQVWLDDGQEVPSVVPVWPTADWHEREQYDLMGVVFAGQIVGARRTRKPAQKERRKDRPHRLQIVGEAATSLRGFRTC